MIITSIAVASGFLEFIFLLQRIGVILYLSSGKLVFTKSVSELLIIHFIVAVDVDVAVTVNVLNNLWWSSRLNPFSVYLTKDLLVSGAYGGSRYTKSPGSTLDNDALKSAHSNITFSINWWISSRCASFIISGFLL